MNRIVKMVALLAVAVSLVAFAAPPESPARASEAETYLVLHKGKAVPADAAAKIAKVGATLVYCYDDLTNACVDLPVELSGVIGVSANGHLMEKAYYSSYGVGAIEVVAPGGDRRFQVPPAPISNGRVLSTWRGGGYVWAQGTSMAAPHVTGVAALIISQYGEMPQGRLQALITQTADPLPCPPNPFDPGGTGSYLPNCQGGVGCKSFYGHGQVNAYNAVTHTSGC